MVFIALALSGVAFLGPWWIRVTGDDAYMALEKKDEVFTYGLWGYCDGAFPGGCHMWPRSVYTEGFVAWFYTCIALFGCGFLLILLAFPMILTAVCRGPPAVTLHNIAGFSLICAGILKIVAILGFGIFTFIDIGAWDFLVDGIKTIYFGYYMGFLASIIAFFSGISIVKRARNSTKV